MPEVGGKHIPQNQKKKKNKSNTITKENQLARGIHAFSHDPVRCSMLQAPWRIME